MQRSLIVVIHLPVSGSFSLPSFIHFNSPHLSSPRAVPRLKTYSTSIASTKHPHSPAKSPNHWARGLSHIPSPALLNLSSHSRLPSLRPTHHLPPTRQPSSTACHRLSEASTLPRSYNNLATTTSCPLPLATLRLTPSSTHLDFATADDHASRAFLGRASLHLTSQTELLCSSATPSRRKCIQILVALDSIRINRAHRL